MTFSFWKWTLGGVVGLALLGLLGVSLHHPDWWLRPDQRGDRLFREKRYEEAAPIYLDPFRQGVAWYRAGQFKEAAASFARCNSAEGAYNQGDALVMLGKYAEAIKAYDRALALRPGWTEAEENRALALARQQRLQSKEGQEGSGELSPDEIVFDLKKNGPGEKETEITGGPPLTDEQMRSLWLRRVQTKPADFLRVKFAYQAQQKEGSP